MLLINLLVLLAVFEKHENPIKEKSSIRRGFNPDGASI
jgi:hypothetical protein